MTSRRQLLLAAAGSLLLPGAVFAVQGSAQKLSWQDFQAQMKKLAAAQASKTVSRQMVAKRGLQLLTQLDVQSAEFQQAVEASYESGNRYWLWQRLMKQKNINGGILNIERKQMVQLHDHPGATGMVRIISGEAEVWLFDEAGKKYTASKKNTVELVRVSRKILRPGDTAVLSPEKGNIHALRSISKECRMLDFFIPPYQRSQRSWFEPLAENWFEQEKIHCRKISQDEYSLA